MMKVKDFAAQEGVTTQAVYKLLKTHAAALDGHIENTKSGRFLDEYAQSYLQEKMVGNTVVVYDRKLEEEIERLKKELKAATDELIFKNKMLIEEQNKRLQIEANTEEKITAAEEKLTEKFNEERMKLTAEVDELKTEINSFKRSIFGFYRKK